MKNDQFEPMVKKHGEVFLSGILENWERCNHIRHTRALTLEERWENFLRLTTQVMAAA